MVQVCYLLLLVLLRKPTSEGPKVQEIIEAGGDKVPIYVMIPSDKLKQQMAEANLF